MRAGVVEIPLDFEAAALPRLRGKSQWKINVLAIGLLKSHPLLARHRRWGSLFSTIGILYVLWLNNNVIVLIELILEIPPNSSDCHMGLRLTLDQLSLDATSIAVSAEPTQSQLRSMIFPWRQLLLLELLRRGFGCQGIFVLQQWDEIKRFCFLQLVCLWAVSKNRVILILRGLPLPQYRLVLLLGTTALLIRQVSHKNSIRRINNVLLIPSTMITIITTALLEGQKTQSTKKSLLLPLRTTLLKIIQHLLQANHQQLVEPLRVRPMLRLSLQKAMAGLPPFLHAIKGLSKQIFSLHADPELPVHSQQIPLLEQSLHPVHNDPFLLARSLSLGIGLLYLQAEQSSSIVLSAITWIRWLQVGVLAFLLDRL